MDQHINEQDKQLIMDQVPDNGAFIKREPIDDEEEEKLLIAPNNGDQPLYGGESGHDYNGEGHVLSHLQAAHHTDRSDEDPACYPPYHPDGSSIADGYDSSTSHGTERAPSRASTKHSEMNSQVNSTTSQGIRREQNDQPVSIQLPGNQIVGNQSPHQENDSYDESHDDSDNNDYYRHEHYSGEQDGQQLSNVPHDNRPIYRLPTAPLVPSGSIGLLPEPEIPCASRQSDIGLLNDNLMLSHRHQALSPHPEIVANNQSSSLDNSEYRHLNDGQDHHQQRGNVPDGNRPSYPLPNALLVPPGSRVLPPSKRLARSTSRQSASDGSWSSGTLPNAPLVLSGSTPSTRPSLRSVSSSHTGSVLNDKIMLSHRHQALSPHPEVVANNQSSSLDNSEYRHLNDGQDHQQRGNALDDSLSSGTLSNAPLVPSGSRVWPSSKRPARSTSRQYDTESVLNHNLMLSLRHQALFPHPTNNANNQSGSSDNGQYRRHNEGQQQHQRGKAPDDTRPIATLPIDPMHSTGSRVTAQLPPSISPSALRRQSGSGLLNQLPTQVRANLPASAPSSMPSRGTTKPEDIGRIIGQMSARLVGRCSDNPNPANGHHLLKGDFFGTFEINHTGMHSGIFNGAQLEWSERKFNGIIYDGNFRSLFIGYIKRENAHEHSFIGEFNGTIDGRFEGELDGVSNKASANAVNNIKAEEDDEDDEDDDVQIIEAWESTRTNERSNVHRNQQSKANPSEPSNVRSNERLTENEHDATLRDIAPIPGQDDSSEDDDDEDVDDNQSEIDESSAPSNSPPINNVDPVMREQQPQRRASDRIAALNRAQQPASELPAGVAQGMQSNENDIGATSGDIASIPGQDDSVEDPDRSDQQSQRRVSARIVDLEKKRALKRAPQPQELPAGMEPEEKMPKMDPRDNCPTRRTIFVECYECKKAESKNKNKKQKDEPKTFATFTELQSHLMKVHNVARYRCLANGCDESFSTSFLLSAHQKDEHREAKTKFVCSYAPSCKPIVRFDTQKSASHHSYYCTKGKFICTYCACHREMISLTIGDRHLNHARGLSNNCPEGQTKCGQVFDCLRAVRTHQYQQHQNWNHIESLFHRKLAYCQLPFAVNRDTMIEHLRVEHRVRLSGDKHPKSLEQLMETMTKEQVNLAMKKFGKQAKSKSPLVAEYDPFVPSTSGTQRPVNRLLVNDDDEEDDEEDEENEEDEEDDEDEGYYRTVPSTSRQQPSYGQSNQSRISKCVIKDFTKN